MSEWPCLPACLPACLFLRAALPPLPLGWHQLPHPSALFANTSPCAVLVGCSVEWEMAALTMAFLGGAAENSGPKGSAENRFHLQGEQMMIKCYHKHVRVGGTKIASAYIEVV